MRIVRAMPESLSAVSLKNAVKGGDLSRAAFTSKRKRNEEFYN
uniref:Uncharacterized protein n=1 Tax=Myoviridae sp. ctnhb8 TaxID=2825171 RepID=A0A8S5VED0_9CAUD|nr:MAG TPA: hypothetical protein [Myoviridae sp. ctnhb8]